MKTSCLFIILFIITLLVGPLASLSILKVEASSSTQVGGVLWENTAWTAANSPYLITNTIQVPSNVTLTIEPGVTITANMSTFMFTLKGQILANGNSNNPIIFNVNHKTLIGESFAGPDAFLKLDYCIVNNASLVWYSVGGGHFNITHSLIQSSDWSMIVSPPNDAYIEFNNFINASISPCDNTLIRHNLFSGSGFPGYFIEGSQNTHIEYNTFLAAKARVLSYRSGFVTGSDVLAMNASNNYWGTTDLNKIKSMIHDNSTDILCGGAINYLPILLEPDPATPTLSSFPLPTPSPEQTPQPTTNSSPTPQPSASPSPEPTTMNVDGFKIESNSTVSAFSYNSTNPEIHFTVQGESGTNGFIKITIAKSFMPTSNINVYLDESPVSYELNSDTDSWTITFFYPHSTHEVRIVQAASQNTIFPEWIWQVTLVAVIAALIVFAGALTIKYKSKM